MMSRRRPIRAKIDQSAFTYKVNEQSPKQPLFYLKWGSKIKLMENHGRLDVVAWEKAGTVTPDNRHLAILGVP